jgi:hypothetical protein
MADTRDLPTRRAGILDAHEALSVQHEELRDRESALLEQREHRDALLDHRDTIAQYNRELAPLSDAQRERLHIPKVSAETDQMIAETLSSIEKAREAWTRATEAWQRVREKLGQKS